MVKTSKGQLPQIFDPAPTEEVGYARVSTDDQDAGMQIAALKRRGIPDDNIFVDYASGGSMKRKQLQLALKLMSGRPGWTLVVWKLDRLSRDLYDIMSFGKQMEAEGWNLISLTETLDTKTPLGKAFFILSGLFAQLERDMTRERTKAGMARRKELGVPLGRQTHITAKQFAEIERRLLAKPKKGKRETIEDIARSIIVKGKPLRAPTINYWFAGWRNKTKADRDAFRKLRPLPTKK